MTWNNRVIRKSKRNPIKNGKPITLHWYDVHEVYYNKKSHPDSWIKDPIIGGFESVKDLRLSLIQMLGDTIRTSVMEIKKVGGKEVLLERPREGK